MKRRLLIIEDNPSITRIVRDNSHIDFSSLRATKGNTPLMLAHREFEILRCCGFIAIRS